MNRRLHYLFCFLALLVFSTGLSAQGLACLPSVNLSIDSECTATIYPNTMQPPSNGGTLVSIKLSDFKLKDDSSLSGGSLQAGVYTGANISFDFSDTDWSAFFNAGMAGPFKVSVLDGSGNSCWGTVMFEDKLPPVLDIPADLSIYCLYNNKDAKGNPAPGALEPVGIATAEESCSKVTISYFDIVTDRACSPTNDTVSVIQRIWTAVNVKGIATVDTQIITIIAVDGASLTRPAVLVTIPCYEGDLPWQLAARVAGTGDDTIAYPSVLVGMTREYLKPDTAVCNVVATYSDVRLSACGPNCGASIKVSRTWLVLDWCNATTTTYQQIIKKTDDIPPVISVPQPDKPYSVTAWACETDIVLPAATVTDRCDDHAKVVAVDGFDAEGLPIEVDLVGGKWVARDVTKGASTFIYTASDCCGNTSTASISVWVLDKIAPVATAKEYITVSLTRSGVDGEGAVAKIKPEHIDNGSYDNCTDVYLEVRREAGAPVCLNEGDDWNHDGNRSTPLIPWNNNITYNDEINGLDQNTGLIHEADSQYDTDKGQFVKFCCEDVGEEHKVWLRVWDDANMSGIYGDSIYVEAADLWLKDNYNETWAVVYVEDNTVPIINCEVDITTYCDEDLAKLNLSTDWKTVVGNVPASWLPWVDAACDYELEYRDAGSVNTCGVGEYIRTYRVKGGKGGNVVVTCTQEISVIDRVARPIHDLPIIVHGWTKCTLTEEDVLNNTVKAALTSNDSKDWFIDYEEYWESKSDYNTPNLGLHCYDSGSSFIAKTQFGTNGLTPVGGGLVKELEAKTRFNHNWREIGCHVFGRKIIIDEYTVGEGCRKWIVRFEYIDWCNPEWNTCLSTIYKYEDTTPPVITTCPSVTVEVDQATCLATAVLNPVATDAGGCETGLRWEVYVPALPRNASNPKFAAGAAPTFTYTNLPVGDHKVLYKVTDGCGNVAECEGVISVWPKAPTPYCVSLSSAVMKNGLVELWAKDFDRGSFANCDPNKTAVLLFTFNRDGKAEHPVVSKLKVEHYFRGLGEEVPGNAAAQLAAYNAGEAQKWIPITKSTVWPDGTTTVDLLGGSSGMQFGCKVGDPINEDFVVEMRVWDTRYFIPGTDAGSDFCRVRLSLVDNQGACGGGSLAVKGTVATSVGEGVSGVATQLDANLPEFPVVAMTTEGAFAFNNIPQGVEYELSAKKDVDYKNGVNTLDLLRIQRHILSMTKLDNAYKYVAADANNDQKIDVSDLVELRKLVLGVINDLPKNESWRFVDATQQFSDISNPWPLNEVIVTSAGDATATNFVAIKVGDVDVTAAVSATSTSTGTRSAKVVKFNIDEQTVKAGEVVNVAVRAENFSEVFGYQFTTELSGMTVEGVESGAITVDEAMYANVAKGKFTMSWTDVNGATVANDAVLFTLKMRANTATNLSSAVSMSSSVTEAEAYVGTDLEVASAKLEVRGGANKGFALSQNEPNPFKAETNVTFSVPTATQVTFRVYDVTGKVLMNRNINANKGENVITLNKTDINASGVVYYQIESGDFTATKKMVIIE
ncbi:MAG: T9SS type A sorting domain-containing protein [Saprospiraceae bacterium]|nr:T9SS type A sorting domain-containing protein [Saprospiraceae bacterium]